MSLVTLKDIHVSFGPNIVLDNLFLELHPREKVALVGINGSGKTTILKIILGSLKADMGIVNSAKSLKIAYLPQEPIFSGDKTVLQELHHSHHDILELQEKLHAAAETLSRLKGDELKSAMKQYDRLSAQFEIAGGFSYETKMKEIAASLGLHNSQFPLKTSQLSGGQLSRLGLAKVLLTDADLLLLDEPTNHLDWDAAIWLEKFLANSEAAALIVSHDRYFLDRIVCKVIELHNHKTTVYPGNYSNYKTEKEKRLLELSRQHEQRLEFVERTRDFIARNKDQEGMRKVARGRKTRLEKLLHNNPDFLEKQKADKEINFSFASVEKRRRLEPVLTFENLTMRFDSLTLFENLNFELFTGQRLGIIGPNGTGKTTLLKIALAKINPTAGKIRLKKNISIAYLDQNSAELNSDNDVLAELSQVAPDKSQQQLRNFLAAFLFTGDTVFKKISQLSGGERNRLAVCKLVLADPDLLILDEPTNHLDIPATEALESALEDYSGTIIAVSHDRFFLDKIADSILVIGADQCGKKSLGSFEFTPTSFSDYAALVEKRIAEQNQIRRTAPAAKKPSGHKPKKTTPPELIQFSMWTPEKIEDAVMQTEEKIESLHERFGDEAVYKNPAKLAQLKKDLEDQKHYLGLLYQAYEWKSK